jgi:hypothetical protein
MATTYGDGKAGQHAKRTAFHYVTGIIRRSMIAMLAGDECPLFLPAHEE